MADAEAEDTFLNSMQAANESTNDHDDAAGETEEAIGEQIESSDEYDPATFVQDTSLPAPSDADSSLHTHTAADSSTAHVPHSNSPEPNLIASAMDGAAEEMPQTNSAAPDTVLRSPPEDTDNKLSDSAPVSAKKQAPDPKAIEIAAPKIRLPHDIVGMLEDRLEEDPKGDVDAWLSLIEEHKDKSRVDDARKVYERFFEIFPTAAEQWSAYLKFEEDYGNKTSKERVLQSALKNAPDSLVLWTTYLDHVRRYFPIHVGDNSQVVHRAFQAVIDAIGHDKDSGNIWTEYITFLKSGPGVIGGSSWVDGQKMDQLRKAYHQAICIPTSSLEAIWKEYSAFEQNLNKMTARKFIADRSPDYITARSSNVELNNITQQLRRTTIPRLPPARGFYGDEDYMTQVDIWKNWIRWEKGDPLVLKESNSASYTKRLLHAYRQALMALRFWPEMYLEASEFCYENDLKSDKAEDKSLGTELLNSGIVANPESCLLAFKLADRLELTTSNGNDETSKAERCNKVRQPFDNLLDTLYGLFEKSVAKEKTELARVEAQFAETASEEVNGDGKDQEGQVNGTPPARPASQKQQQIQMVKAMSEVQTSILSRTITCVWIALMRAVQRMQGKGDPRTAIKGSRGIFLEARKRGRFTNELWIAAALLEYHANSDSITANKLFNRSVRDNVDDEKLALAYIKWLTSVNDHTNARVVFEKAVKQLSQNPQTLPKTKVLYTYFHRYETQYGELAQVTKLEARMKEAFPDDPKLAAFSQRFLQEEDRFDPTAIRPLISPRTQTKPKLLPPTIVEETVAGKSSSPPSTFAHQVTNSPKRPLPLDDFDAGQNPPRKIARGESPLAGAAGRRLDQLKRTRQPFDSPQPSTNAGAGGLPPPPPPLLPREVLFLLSIIPPASSYPSDWAKIPPEAVVQLIRDTHLPESAQQLPSRGTSAMGGGGQYGPPPMPTYTGNVSYQR